MDTTHKDHNEEEISQLIDAQARGLARLGGGQVVGRAAGDVGRLVQDGAGQPLLHGVGVVGQRLGRRGALPSG